MKHDAERQDNKKLALEDAIRRAAHSLDGVDLPERTAALGLPFPDKNGELQFRMLGRTVAFRPPAFEGWDLMRDAPLHPADRLLVLHYLQHDLPLRPTGRWLTFRHFPGGQFYWGPFQTRSVKPLIHEIGNDLERLVERLRPLDCHPLKVGDCGVRVRLFGNVDLALVYNRGDEEFGPTVDILFDASLKRVFPAEDAAALASRLCLRLCEKTCETCSGCGLCDTGY